MSPVFASAVCGWGTPERSLDPWRDTGVVIRGPAVADVDLAFSRMWEIVGEPLPEDELREPETIPAAGDVTLGSWPASRTRPIFTALIN